MANEFYEKQRFTQWWIYAVLGAIVLGTALADYSEYGAFRWQQPGMWLAVALLALFWLFRLETRITPAGIQYRFFPLHLQWKTILREKLRYAWVRQYKPLLEYGGWGIRFGVNGKAYNTRGNMGIQLELQNGNKILIGTQQPEKAKAALQDYRLLSEPPTPES